jgi:hypothetical protein
MTAIGPGPWVAIAAVISMVVSTAPLPYAQSRGVAISRIACFS